MSEIRLIDANALKYKNLAEVNGKLTHVLTAEEINNAPTVKSFTVDEVEEIRQATMEQVRINCKQNERQKGEISDDYLIGYLQGCKDTLDKFEKLQRIQIQIRQNKRGDEDA